MIINKKIADIFNMSATPRRSASPRRATSPRRGQSSLNGSYSNEKQGFVPGIEVDTYNLPETMFSYVIWCTDSTAEKQSIFFTADQLPPLRASTGSFDHEIVKPDPVVMVLKGYHDSDSFIFSQPENFYKRANLKFGPAMRLSEPISKQRIETLLDTVLKNHRGLPRDPSVEEDVTYFNESLVRLYERLAVDEIETTYYSKKRIVDILLKNLQFSTLLK